jgi:hypothetical protein
MRTLVAIVLAVAALGVGAASSVASAGRTVDLTSGRLDGSRVLGQTVAQVTAALGRPDYRLPSPRYRIGWGQRPDFAVEVLFRRSHGILRAWSIAFERGPVRDVKLGDLLGRRSAALQRAVRSQYADSLTLVRPYACKGNGECVGEFAPRPGSHLHLTFGTHRVLGTWLTLWQALPA